MLPQKSQKGFTLIEMLVAVVILGILASVAMPSYLDNVRRGRRADARAKLMQDVQYMESFLSINSRYDIDTTGAAVAIPYAVSPVNTTGSTSDYNISFSPAVAALTYTLQAVPRPGGKMATDGCGTLSINNFGARSVSGTLSVDECWNK